MIAEEERAEGQPTGPSPDVRAVRAKAARRSWFCAGAGFALLGRPGLALSTFVASLALYAAVVWLALQPGMTAFAAVLFALGIAMVLALSAVHKLQPQRPSPRLLVRAFPFATAVGGICAATALVMLLTQFGSVQLAGSGMSPTLAKGERALYRRHVEPERLSRGNVVLYRLSGHSAWGTAGWLVVSRILAVPGDQLSIQDRQYLVNGQPGPAVASTGQYTPVIQVPLAPAALTVPEDCYFIAQDDPVNSFDSRVLSWVEASDVVSTRLYYLRGKSLLKAVE